VSVRGNGKPELSDLHISGSLLGIPIYPDKRNIDIALEKTPTYPTGYLLIKIKNIYTTVVVVS